MERRVSRPAIAMLASRKPAILARFTIVQIVVLRALEELVEQCFSLASHRAKPTAELALFDDF